jgi:hypothetical protein
MAWLHAQLTQCSYFLKMGTVLINMLALMATDAVLLPALSGVNMDVARIVLRTMRRWAHKNELSSHAAAGVQSKEASRKHRARAVCHFPDAVVDLPCSRATWVSSTAWEPTVSLLVHGGWVHTEVGHAA